MITKIEDIESGLQQDRDQLFEALRFFKNLRQQIEELNDNELREFSSKYIGNKIAYTTQETQNLEGLISKDEYVAVKGEYIYL